MASIRHLSAYVDFNIWPLLVSIILAVLCAARTGVQETVFRRNIVKSTSTMTCSSATHTQCIVMFPLKEWLRERATMLRYTCLAYLVIETDRIPCDVPGVAEETAERRVSSRVCCKLRVVDA
jgi:hypothetical protein